MADRWLAPIHGGPVPENQKFAPRGWRASDNPGLPMTLAQYLQLLDWSGRQARSGKRGKVPGKLAPILTRLGLNQERWIDLATDFDALFRRIAGDVAEVERYAESRGRHWFQGITNCRELFTPARDEGTA